MLCRNIGTSLESSTFATSKSTKPKIYGLALAEILATGVSLEEAVSTLRSDREHAILLASRPADREAAEKEELGAGPADVWAARPIAIHRLSEKALQALEPYVKVFHNHRSSEWLVRRNAPGNCYELALNPYQGLIAGGPGKGSPYDAVSTTLRHLHLNAALWAYECVDTQSGEGTEVLSQAQYVSRCIEEYGGKVAETTPKLLMGVTVGQALSPDPLKFAHAAAHVDVSPMHVLKNHDGPAGTVSQYLLTETAVHTPSLPKVLTNDPAEVAFSYVDISGLTPGPTPNFDSFLSRVHPACRELFMALVFAPLDARSRHRKVCWIRSDGYDGKSAFFNAINRWSGGKLVAGINSNSLTSEFGLETTIGKRILMIGDCQNSHLLDTNAVHSITGSDGAVVINRKNQPQIDYKFEAMVFVAANSPPDLKEYKQNALTRLAYIPLTPATDEQLKRYARVDKSGKIMRQSDGTPIFTGSNMEEELVAEMPHIMHKCRAEYTRLCPNHREIQVPPKAHNVMLEECGSISGDDFGHYADLHLDFGPEYSINWKDLRNHYNRVTKSGHGDKDHFWGDFARWLAKRDCTLARSQDKGSRQRVCMGIRLKPD